MISASVEFWAPHRILPRAAYLPLSLTLLYPLDTIIPSICMESDAKEVPQFSETQDQEIRDGKFFAAIGYFSFLCVVPLFLKRENKFAQFHGRQGLVLLILELAASMLKVIPVLGDVIFTIAWVIFGVLSLIAVLKVVTNKYWKLPLISQIAEKITL